MDIERARNDRIQSVGNGASHTLCQWAYDQRVHKTDHSQDRKSMKKVERNFSDRWSNGLVRTRAI